MELRRNSFVELFMPAMLLQAALYVTAMMKGVGEAYERLFVMQCVITVFMFLSMRKIKADSTMVVSVISLLCIGGFIQTVLSEELAGYKDGAKAFAVHVAIAFAVFLLVVILMNSKRKWLKFFYTDKGCGVLFIISILFYGACLISGRVWGAANWIHIGSISLQLTEISKLIYFWMLGVLAEREKFEEYGGKLLIMFSFHGFCLVLANEFGFLLIIAFVTLIVTILRTEAWEILLQSIRKPLIVLAIVFTALLVMGAIVYGFGELTGFDPISSFISDLTDKIRGRFLGFLYPEEYPDTYGYQSQMVNLAIFNGGLFGSEKELLIPIAESDMIFAAVISTMGLIMGIIIIAFYLLFFINGCQVALKKNSGLALTFVLAIFVQNCYNLASVIGVVPISGVPLGLISAGGTSMVSMMVMIGMIVSISGEKYQYVEEGKGGPNEKKKNYNIDDDGDLFDDIIGSGPDSKGRSHSRIGASNRCKQRVGRRADVESADHYWDYL